MAKFEHLSVTISPSVNTSKAVMQFVLMVDGRRVSFEQVVDMDELFDKTMFEALMGHATRVLQLELERPVLRVVR